MEEQLENVRWERRFSKRVNYSRSGIFGLPTAKHKFVTHIMNLSETGVFMNTSEMFEPGTRLHLVIRDNGRYIQAEGIVTRVIRKDPSNLFSSECGMGVRFAKANEALLSIYNEKASSPIQPEPFSH